MTSTQSHELRSPSAGDERSPAHVSPPHPGLATTESGASASSPAPVPRPEEASSSSTVAPQWAGWPTPTEAYAPQRAPLPRPSQETKHKSDTRGARRGGRPDHATKYAKKPSPESAAKKGQRKKQPTRQAKGASAIAKSVLDSYAKESPPLDDPRCEEKSESGDESDEEPLNSEDQGHDSHDDMPIYAPVQPWQSAAGAGILAAPVVLATLVSLCFPWFRFALPQLLLAYLYGVWRLRRYVLSSDYLNPLFMSLRMMPAVPQTISGGVTSARIDPVIEGPNPSWTYIAWFLQMFVPVLTERTHAVSGLYVQKVSSLEPLTHTDQRCPNQHSQTAAPWRVCLQSGVVLSFTTGLTTMRITCAAMVNQFVTRLRDLGEEDREKEATHMSARVTNLHIRWRNFPDVAWGSAQHALDWCRSADASFAVAKAARSFSVSASCLLALSVCCVCIVVFSAHILATASILIDGQTPFVFVVGAIVVAPLLEEAFKSALSSVLGVHRIHIATIFGIVEFALYGFQPAAVPALCMHVLTGMLDFKRAWLLHFGFNVYACIAMGAFAKLLIQWRLIMQPAPLLPSPRYDPMSGVPPYAHIRELGSESLYEFVCRHIETDPLMCRRYDWCTPEACEPYWDCIHRTSRPPPCNAWTQDTSADSEPILPGSLFWFTPPLILSTMVTVHLGRKQRRSHLARLVIPAILECVVAVGYRYAEVLSLSVDAHGAKLSFYPNFFEHRERSSPCRALAFTLARYVPPFPDFRDPETALLGCIQRFCRNPPVPNKTKLRLLRRFVRRYVKDHFTPIPPDADLSLEAWLARTDYPEWRKMQLRRAWYDEPWVTESDKDNKGFIKMEFYTEFKTARGINSRSDKFKCFSGRFFKLMEDQIYHQDCYDGGKLNSGSMGPFVKHIPTHLRPQFMANFFQGEAGPFYETDYSQFEKHFTPAVMRSLEVILYEHMLSNFPEASRVIVSTLTGTNVCRYKSFKIRVRGRRMSGDMCTSLGNGFSNLMLFMFVAQLKGGRARGVVEGDDALFVSTVPLDKQDFADVGFTIKIDVHSELHESSFCGTFSSPDGHVLRSFVRVWPKFGWSFSPRRNGGPVVRMGLLRARALSLAYECPGCPILSALAKRALELTAGFRPIFDYSYHTAELMAWTLQFGEDMTRTLLDGPTLPARLAYEAKFGVSVSMQLRVEQIISQWSGSPLDHPVIHDLFHRQNDMYLFASRYTGPSEAIVSARLVC